MSTDPDTGYGMPRRECRTFWESPEPPAIGQAWRNRTFRQRMDVWYKEGSRCNPVASVIYVIVAIKLALYLGTFYFFLRDGTQPIFGELNAKKFLLYNIIGDVTGFNSTNGVLGFRVKNWFVSWYNFLHVGTLTCPLVSGLPNTRRPHLIALYVSYVSLLIWAMFQSTITCAQVWPAVLCLSIMLPQDLVLFLASRGEHYGYFLVCTMFTFEECMFGWQAVMAAIWFWAGVAKMGPWFKYVVAMMSINGALLRQTPRVLKMLHRGSLDASPSKLAERLSCIGTLLELSVSPLCVVWPKLGVPIAVLFHTYILAMVPTASVMEWNIFCILCAIYLFGMNSVNIPLNISPMLQVFLLLVLAVIPLFGQIFPKLVPFLVAYRPYAGNWRFSWHIVDNKAKYKLRRLKSLDSVIVVDNTVDVWPNKDYAQQFEFVVTAANMIYPHFRTLVPIVEELEAINGWNSDDYTILSQEGFYNAVYGWTLGTGFYSKHSHFTALKSICKFDPGECYIAIFEPMSLLDHTSEWSVVDVADSSKPLLSGRIPFSELEKFHPTAVPRAILGLKKTS